MLFGQPDQHSGFFFEASLSKSLLLYSTTSLTSSENHVVNFDSKIHMGNNLAIISIFSATFCLAQPRDICRCTYASLPTAEATLPAGVRLGYASALDALWEDSSADFFKMRLYLQAVTPVSQSVSQSNVNLC